MPVRQKEFVFGLPLQNMTGVSQVLRLGHCFFQGMVLAKTCSGSQAAIVAPTTTPTMRPTAWRRVKVSSAIVLVKSSNQPAIVISFCTENYYKSCTSSFY